MSPVSEIRLLFLASGRGTCFDAVAAAVAAGEIPRARIVGLLSNKAEAPALEKARARGVPVEVVESAAFRKKDGKWDRAGYDDALAHTVENYAPHFICLAGYLLLLDPKFVAAREGKIINIHPSLLPAFKGLGAQKQALDYGVKWTGCTVHRVTAELDAGPILAQEVIEVLPGDTVETLSARLLPLEHRAYVRALKALCAD